MYIQYFFVLASGVQHRGWTIIYSAKCPPIFPVPTWHHTYNCVSSGRTFIKCSCLSTVLIWYRYFWFCTLKISVQFSLTIEEKVGIELSWTKFSLVAYKYVILLLVFKYMSRDKLTTSTHYKEHLTFLPIGCHTNPHIRKMGQFKTDNLICMSRLLYVLSTFVTLLGARGCLMNTYYVFTISHRRDWC